MAQPPGYENSIPQPNDTIGASQTPFLTNFAQLFNAFDNDHVPLNAVSNAGNHNVARMNLNPFSLTTNLSEVAFYGKGRKYQTTQMYFREEANGLEYQYSNYQIYPLPHITNNNGLVQVPYFSWLPGNIIVYFGSLNNFGANQFPIILNPVVCNNILGIQLCNTSLDGSTPAALTPPVVVNIPLTPEGLATQVVLKNSAGISTFTPQYYLIFGNAVT